MAKTPWSKVTEEQKNILSNSLKALAELTDDELENRLLCLREKIARLESKSRGDDYYF